MKISESLGSNKNKSFFFIKNSKGQIAIESLLLMSVLVAIFISLSGAIKEKKLLSKLVEKPMANVKSMSGYGTWKSDGCTAPGKSKQTIGKCHPNSIARSLSSDPN